MGVGVGDVGEVGAEQHPIAERLTGWPQAEAIGRPLAEVFRIFDGRTGARLEAPAARALRDGAIVELPPHTILRARDGRDIPIDDSSAPILAEDGQPAGTVLVFADRTGQRDAEVALRRAVALAYNGDAHIRVVRGGLALPAQSTVVPFTSGYDPAYRSEMSEHSVAKARALGVAGDADLTASEHQARDVLGREPTPLAVARQLVTTYQTWLGQLLADRASRHPKESA